MDIPRLLTKNSILYYSAYWYPFLVIRTEERMNNLNLMVKFKLATSGDVQIKGVSRMKVDGRGSVLLYDSNGEVERIDVRQMESFSVHALSVVQTAFAA